MTMSAVVVRRFTLGGKIFNESSTITGDDAVIADPSIAAGSAGSIATRTDADTAVLTIDTSTHAFVETDRVDIYWTVGGVSGCRYGMAVGTVSGASVAIDGGAGDDLPAALSTIMLVEPTEIKIKVLGTDVNAIFLASAKKGQFVFIDDGDLEVFEKTIGAAKSYAWHDEEAVVNPITGDQIEKIYVSHGDAAAVIMQIGIVYDN